jgi:arsenite methyltransferase
MNKANYGFDAPGIMRNLLIFGFLGVSIGFGVLFLVANVILIYISYLILFLGSILFFLGSCMLAYGLKGKYNVRKMMLQRIDWKGNENVLDIGCGTGLLLNGAAKFLTTGKAIGTDIWRVEDLSANTIENALKNAEYEGVRDKIEIRTEDARKLNFPNESFEVVLSLFCIHNIEDKAEQEKACFEITRVLKPNGIALIGDYIPTSSYAKAFQKAGLQVKSSKSYFTIAYGPMWMVEAVKKV